MTEKSQRTTKEIEQNAVELIDSSMKYLSFCRNLELQEKAVSDLLDIIPWLKNAKYLYIDENNESNINYFFYLQLATYSVVSMLSCIISVKKEKFHEAWDYIIDAEEYISVAFRVAEKTDFLNELSNIRFMMEKVLLPEMPFYNSMGSLTTGGECNICNKDYADCDHIEGLIYSGKVCRLINIKDLDLNHSAIVQKPRDRRCIPIKIHVQNNQWRDLFTWIVEDDEDNSTDITKHDGKQIRFVFFNNKYIDTD